MRDVWQPNEIWSRFIELSFVADRLRHIVSLGTPMTALLSPTSCGSDAAYLNFKQVMHSKQLNISQQAIGALSRPLSGSPIESVGSPSPNCHEKGARLRRYW